MTYTKWIAATTAGAGTKELTGTATVSLYNPK